MCATTRMTLQYFFMAAKSFSSCFFPASSCHFLQYFVKAFFLLLCLKRREGLGGEMPVPQNCHTPPTRWEALCRAPVLGRGRRKCRTWNFDATPYIFSCQGLFWQERAGLRVCAEREQKFYFHIKKCPLLP